MNVEKNERLFQSGTIPGRIEPWPKGTPSGATVAWPSELAVRRFVQPPERDGTEPKGKPSGRAHVTVPQNAGQPGLALKAPGFSRGAYVTASALPNPFPSAL